MESSARSRVGSITRPRVPVRAESAKPRARVSAPDSGLLDLIYEAALEPDLWIEVMERLGDEVGGGAAILTTIDRKTGIGSALTARVDPAAVKDYLSYYASINPLQRATRASRYYEDWSPKVVLDEELVDRRHFVATEYYNDFLRPMSAEWKMIFRLERRERDLSALVIARPQGKGRFTDEALARANVIYPHLVRAFAMSRKLANERGITDGLASGLDAAPGALLILDDKGIVRRLNARADRLVTKGLGLSLRAGRLVATHPDDERRLHTLLNDAAAEDPARRRGGFACFRAQGLSPALSISVSPVHPRQISSLANGPAILVCIDGADVVSPDGAALKGSFALTSAENRVAMTLFEGLSTKEIAARLGVSVNTVRAQLSTIFVKTGTHRQSELVKLIAERFAS